MSQSESIKTIGFSIVAGLFAGIILLGLNLVLLNQYYEFFDSAVLDELLATGEFDEEEYDRFVQNQQVNRNGISIASGLMVGALFGFVYIYTKKHLQRFSAVKRALIVAGITWFVLFVIPTLKYPVLPIPLVDEEGYMVDGDSYQLPFFGYFAVSAASAIAVGIGFRKVKRQNKVFGASAVYLVIMAIAFFVFPAPPADPTYVAPAILAGFRSLFSASMTIFWFSLAVICGVIWKKSISEPEIKSES